MELWNIILAATILKYQHYLHILIRLAVLPSRQDLVAGYRQNLDMKIMKTKMID